MCELFDWLQSKRKRIIAGRQLKILQILLDVDSMDFGRLMTMKQYPKAKRLLFLR